MTGADLLKILGFYGRFTPNYSRIGYTARKLRWSNYPRNFSGQRWLVTGASGGIGAAIVQEAAEAGAEVLAVARNPGKLHALSHGIGNDAAQRISTATCDLSSVAAVDELLATLRADGQPFDVLVNNVGVLFNELRLSPEGFEATYATNLLCQFQLTEGLLEGGLLADEALIINMASGGLYNVPLNTKLLNVTDAGRYSGKLAYASHKRGQAALSALWDDRLHERGGRSYVMHPGWVRTEGVRQSLPVFYKIQGLILRTPAEGADTALWLAAERPAAGGRTIWFDRAVRPQHVFAHTHSAQCTERDLLDHVQRDLDKARAELSSAVEAAVQSQSKQRAPQPAETAPESLVEKAAGGLSD